MKLKDDLVPLKVVLDELGVSRNTLWRASQAGIAGFPAPTIIRRLVFWKMSELGPLEEAMLGYQGRVKFERQREAERKIEALKRGQTKARKAKSSSVKVLPGQTDLFDR